MKKIVSNPANCIKKALHIIDLNAFPSELTVYDDLLLRWLGQQSLGHSTMLYFVIKRPPELLGEFVPIRFRAFSFISF